jgi:hypothetical protein
MLPVAGAIFINRDAAPPMGGGKIMSKHRKIATATYPARALPPVFDDDPARDDPHDAIEQELLGIWLSISRLHQMIRGTPAAVTDGCVIPLRRRAAPKSTHKSTFKKATPKKSAHKKPRRKAA